MRHPKGARSIGIGHPRSGDRCTETLPYPLDPLWVAEQCLQRPRQGVAPTSLAMSATPGGVAIACFARSTGLRGYAPRPVAMERAPARGASPPPSALSYRTGRCPIGQVGRARCLIGRGDDPFAGVMDPDRDPRFIATGRAAIAAMTCGQIDLLTSTPLGCRTPDSATPWRGRDRLHCPVHGSSGLRPSTTWLWSGHPQGVPPFPHSSQLNI